MSKRILLYTGIIFISIITYVYLYFQFIERTQTVAKKLSWPIGIQASTELFEVPIVISDFGKFLPRYDYAELYKKKFIKEFQSKADIKNNNVQFYTKFFSFLPSNNYIIIKADTLDFWKKVKLSLTDPNLVIFDVPIIWELECVNYDDWRYVDTYNYKISSNFQIDTTAQKELHKCIRKLEIELGTLNNKKNIKRESYTIRYRKGMYSIQCPDSLRQFHSKYLIEMIKQRLEECDINNFDRAYFPIRLPPNFIEKQISKDSGVVRIGKE